MRRPVKLAFLALAALSMTATSAGAHNTWPESSFSPWKAFRTKVAYSPTGTKLGEVRVEARRMASSNPAKGYYGFRIHYLTDILADNANGNLYCIEAWMDFKKLNGAGPHRNPTVARHCNFGGGPTGYHNGMMDVVLHDNYEDFKVNICQSFMHGASGIWDRYNCHGDMTGADAQWPDTPISKQDFTTDNQLGGCLTDGNAPTGYSYLTDTRWIEPGLSPYGCMGYIDWF